MGRVITTSRCYSHNTSQICRMGEELLQISTTISECSLFENASQIYLLGKQILIDSGLPFTDSVILEACGLPIPTRTDTPHYSSHSLDSCSPACQKTVQLPRSTEREALVMLATVFDNASSLQEEIPSLRKYQPLHINGRPTPKMFYDEQQSGVSIIPVDSTRRSERCLEYVLKTAIGLGKNKNKNKNSQRYYTKIWFDPEKVLSKLGCIPVNEPKNRDIVAYITTTRLKCRVSHWGIWDNGMVRSKWGVGDLFLHPVNEVPPSYGSRVRFFRVT